MTFELVENYYPEPEDSDSDVYEDGCQNEVPVDEDHPFGHCGGKVWSTGGHGYYNGSYQCYTLYLTCENCGPYEVECV